MDVRQTAAQAVCCWAADVLRRRGLVTVPTDQLAAYGRTYVPLDTWGESLDDDSVTVRHELWESEQAVDGRLLAVGRTTSGHTVTAELAGAELDIVEIVAAVLPHITDSR